LRTTTRRQFSARLAALVTGADLAVIPPGTPPAPPMVAAAREGSLGFIFPTKAVAQAKFNATLDEVCTLTQRVYQLDPDLAHELNIAVAPLTSWAGDIAAATIHEQLLATYREGARLLIEIRPGGAA
jgi:hypothetical protein